jgi:hypothetical protein
MKVQSPRYLITLDYYVDAGLGTLGFIYISNVLHLLQRQL